MAAMLIAASTETWCGTLSIGCMPDNICDS